MIEGTDHDALLAKKRDARYREWLQNKALRDKTIELLSQLDSSRSEHFEKLRESAISIAAVERILDSCKVPTAGSKNGKKDDEDIEDIDNEEVSLFPNP